MRLNTLFIIVSVAGCTNNHMAKSPTAKAQPVTGPSSVAASAPTLLYKTRGDYHNLVPVQLSEDRKSIVSYPAPSDVTGQQPQPTALTQGYWLDNRGIGPNVAFLKLTYADYAQLATAPSLQDMDALIIDRDPLLALCDCGPRSSYAASPTAQLNALIDGGQLASRCKVLK